MEVKSDAIYIYVGDGPYASIQELASAAGPIRIYYRTWAGGGQLTDVLLKRGFRWRTGRKVGRTIYAQLGVEPSDGDPLIGVMDSPDLASAACCGHNASDDVRARLVILREAVQRVIDDDESRPGGWGPDVTMVAVLREAMEASRDRRSD